MIFKSLIKPFCLISDRSILVCIVLLVAFKTQLALASSFTAVADHDTGRINFSVNCTTNAYCQLKEGGALLASFDFLDSPNAQFSISKQPNTYTFKLESYSAGEFGGLELTETDVVTVTLLEPTPTPVPTPTPTPVQTPTPIPTTEPTQVPTPTPIPSPVWPSIPATPYRVEGYEIYFGDVNGDGKSGDVYFHVKDTFVLIHSEIAIPIFISSDGSFVVYEGNDVAVELNKSLSQLTEFRLGEVGEDFLYQDVDGDGYSDLVVNLNHSTSQQMVLSSRSNANPFIAYIAYSTPASQITNFTYDALGRLRVVEKEGGAVESIQYDKAGNRCNQISGIDSEEGYCDE